MFYVTDTFEIEISLVSLLEGSDILTMNGRIAAFQRKVVQWREHFENSN